MATTIIKPITQTSPKDKTERPWLWNVVLIDDEEHTYDYVIEMMQELFAHDQTRAFKIAKTVDKDGRAVCLTTHKELAELKREQIQAFGRDKFIDGCAGAMTAVIEPAEFGCENDGTDHEDGDKPGSK